MPRGDHFGVVRYNAIIQRCLYLVITGLHKGSYTRMSKQQLPINSLHMEMMS